MTATLSPFARRTQDAKAAGVRVVAGIGDARCMTCKALVRPSRIHDALTVHADGITRDHRAIPEHRCQPSLTWRHRCRVCAGPAFDPNMWLDDRGQS